MKKIIAIIFCLLVSTTMAFAQHIVDFKGINLDNSLVDFVEQMQKKGFTFKENDTEDHFLIMQGVVYGKMREVNIGYTPKTYRVWVVSVLFDEKVDATERVKLYNTTKREFRDYMIDEDPTKHTWKLDFGEYGSIEFQCSMGEYYEDGEEYQNVVVYKDGTNAQLWFDEDYELRERKSLHEWVMNH